MSQGLRPFAVTVNWNRANDTLECVDSLLQGNPGTEVVVVDNGSQDRSVPLIRERYPGLEILENPENMGYAMGANQGVRRALELGATHVLLINNDAVAGKGMVDTVLEAMSRHPSAGVAGPKIFYFGTDIMWFNGGHFNDLLGLSTHPLMDRQDDGGDQDRKVGFITGCAMMVKAEVFRDIGFFDEDFEIYAEDLDFCLRAKEMGYGVWLVPRAVAGHKVSLSTGVAGSNLMTPYRSYYYARNMLIMVRKRMKGARFVTGFMGQTFILLPYYFMLMGVQRTRGSFRQYLKGYFHALEGMIKGRY
ncbi:MAG: glycosyltransferase family 2 protein [Euryarchaeota archaeon]|nr:glycosyltransferase family 2 protein [Euryarchaeota archaeon]